MGELISVIVPIHNVAPYLDKCIKSIINQTYKDLEIILVDDGSTDESKSICDKYAKKDSRIRVIHQANGKITRARKAGLKAATGKFIGFVDGDDWIEIEMYSTLVREAVRNKADVVMSGMWRDNYEGAYAKWSVSERFNRGVYSGEKLEKLKRYTLSSINGSLCNKIIRAGIIKEEINYINDELYGIEDDIVTHMCILKANKVVILDEAFYHGYERYDSATHTKHDDYLLMMHRALVSYDHMKSIFIDEVFYTEINRAIASKVVDGVGHVTEDFCIAKYILPQDISIKENDKVILYGGGVVGESYYTQLSKIKGTKIKWVDGHRRSSIYTNTSLCKASDVDVNNYDIVIIAMKRKGSNIEEVKKTLTELGVAGNIIWWKEPISIVDI